VPGSKDLLDPRRCSSGVLMPKIPPDARCL
jgi:hypothetical protein